ncbi:MAG: DUF2283 domain-containing protein [Bacteroidetes bacterium]|nr:DUF2283 domain-containing protein [Bacteroidota bacterium]
MEKSLNKVGQFDYDYANDILFFKVKDREYSHSVELSSLVIDFDEENFIVGLQIMNASEVFQLSKKILLGVSGFNMQAKIVDGAIQINLSFGMVERNKQMIEYKPIIFDRVGPEVPDSKISCIA